LCCLQALIPSQEEKKKQRQFLAHLDSLVCSDWPGAKLFLYGSCANDFGVCNSDIDVCLAVDDENFTKAQLVVKMAEILRSDNMQNVQVGMLIFKRVGGGETV
jgi:DNA polymerase sigma